jgi:hypothetical protein
MWNLEEKIDINFSQTLYGEQPGRISHMWHNFCRTRYIFRKGKSESKTHAEISKSEV